VCAIVILLMIVSGACASDDPKPEDSTNQPARLLREDESNGTLVVVDTTGLERDIPEPPSAEPSETSTSEAATSTSEVPEAAPADEASTSPDVSTAP